MTGRPLSSPEEGLRAPLFVRVTRPIREHLEAIRVREELASISDAVDWLIRQDRESQP